MMQERATDDDDSDPRDQKEPALPSNRRAPAPATFLCRKPDLFLAHRFAVAQRWIEHVGGSDGLERSCELRCRNQFAVRTKLHPNATAGGCYFNRCRCQGLLWDEAGTRSAVEEPHRNLAV